MSRLSTNSRFSWGYALTEIILITIGISLAFVLSSWNERRQERKLEQFYLNNIKGDVEQSIRLLEYHLALDSSQVTGAQRLYELLREGSGVDRDSLRIYLNSFNTNPRFKVQDYNYQSLLQSGNYKIVRNDSLRETMDEFFLDLIPNVVITEGYFLDRLDTYYFPVKERIYIAYSNSFQNISGLFDPFFIDNVFVIPAYASQEMRQLNRALIAGKALVEKIQGELK